MYRSAKYISRMSKDWTNFQKTTIWLNNKVTMKHFPKFSFALHFSVDFSRIPRKSMTSNNYDS